VLIVRKFHPSDMFSVIKLSFETLTERYNSSLFNYFYETYPEGFWVCEKNHKIIGFIVGVKIGSEIVRILMLSVSLENRRKGVGNIILNNFLREVAIEKIKFVELEVKTKNHSAIKFYKKNGFKILDTLPNFYQNGDDAYIMRLSLD
jgi:ribosomal-protein-alanine N-acetyltransferase